MSEIRVLPLPKVTGVWDHDVSRYPDRVRIPMADGNKKSRVFAYEVAIMADDDPKNRFFKSVYFAGVGFGEGHEDNDGITLMDVPVQNLPKGKKLTIAVRPVSSLGTKGKAIGATWRV